MKIINSLNEISNNYEAIFMDLWGCVHDGRQALPNAIVALQNYKKTGGKVVLVTNSPQMQQEVKQQLTSFGVPEDVWDGIASSGDSARVAMFQGVVGKKIWFIGEERDKRFFDPLNIVENPVHIMRVNLDDAEGIVCTGPFNPVDDPETLLPKLKIAAERGLKFLCANPDIVVDRGNEREWCAGALAKLYSSIGGESLYFGKPHQQIYDLAFQQLDRIHPGIAKHSILATGDGIQTDIRGAINQQIDSLFVTGGLAAMETKTQEQPDIKALQKFLSDAGLEPTFSIGHLR
ncbi:MAG: TIGR01459 family HAD-type hydrolase [Aestuariivita sp.]|nr:TIGR01459 family HAD-type hydrolase [Aestuariivita sp.]